MRHSYGLIREQVRAKLLSGDWAAGERLPGESEMATTYGVARMTVRHALDDLVREGLLIRKQGAGTFAAGRSLARDTQWLRSFTEQMRSQGHTVTARLLRARRTAPTAEVAEALGIPEGADVIEVRRLRSVDRRPALLQVSWLPFGRFPGLENNALIGGSLYAAMAENFGVTPNSARQRAYPVAADGQVARLLKVAEHSPVMRLIRNTFDDTNSVIEYVDSYQHPDLPLEYWIDRRKQ